eukprot:s3825_g7.t2
MQLHAAQAELPLRQPVPSRSRGTCFPQPSGGGWRVCSVIPALGLTRRRCNTRRRAGERSCNVLVEWLKGTPGVEGLDDLQIGQSTYEAGGLGVFAAKDFAAGDLVCRVPREALLIAGESAESLALRYLQERSRADSLFKAYWPSLPVKEELAPLHPLHWPPVLRRPEYVADLLQGSLAAQRTFQARLTMGEVDESMLEALLVVDSRSFNITDEKGRVLRALVPFIDLVNTFVPLASADGSWNCWFRGNLEEGAMLHAERPIPRGTELVHCYGTFSSAELWATYGFLPLEAMESPDEAVSVLQAPLISIPLNDMDRDQLKRLKQMLEPRHWLDEHTMLFEIPWDAVDGPLDQVLELHWPGTQAIWRKGIHRRISCSHWLSAGSPHGALNQFSFAAGVDTPTAWPVGVRAWTNALRTG